MKKLIIALFAFVAVFAVAGSANAFTMDENMVAHSSIVYANGNLINAVLKDDNTIDLSYDIGSGIEVHEDFKKGVSSLVGLSFHASDSTQGWLTYLEDSDSDIHVVAFDVDAGTPQISDVEIFTTATGAWVSKNVDSSGYPVCISDDLSSEFVNVLKVHSYSGATWVDTQITSGVTGARDVYLSGTDYVAHIAYQKGNVVHSSGYDYASETYSYTEATLEETLSGQASKIEIYGLDNARAGVVLQAGSADSYAMEVIDYNGTVYDADTFNAYTLSGEADFSAQVDAADSTKVVVAQKNDSDVLNEVTVAKVDGTNTAVAIDTDANIATIDYAGKTTANNNIATYTIQNGIDQFYKTTDGGTPILIFEQAEGSAVPELPGSTLWKVLIGILALGLVVGVAAFMRKKKK